MIDLDHLQESAGKQVRVRPQFHAELQRLGQELSDTSRDMLDVVKDVEKASKVRVTNKQHAEWCCEFGIEQTREHRDIFDQLPTFIAVVQLLPVPGRIFGFVAQSVCLKSTVDCIQEKSHPHHVNGNAQQQATAGKIKLEFNAVHSNHLRVTKKDQALVGKCKASLTLSVQKVSDNVVVVIVPARDLLLCWSKYSPGRSVCYWRAGEFPISTGFEAADLFLDQI